MSGKLIMLMLLGGVPSQVTYQPKSQADTSEIRQIVQEILVELGVIQQQQVKETLVRAHCAQCHNKDNESGWKMGDANFPKSSLVNRVLTLDKEKVMPKNREISDSDRLNLLREIIGTQ